MLLQSICLKQHLIQVGCHEKAVTIEDSAGRLQIFVAVFFSFVLVFVVVVATCNRTIISAVVLSETPLVVKKTEPGLD